MTAALSVKMIAKERDLEWVVMVFLVLVRNFSLIV